jgi:7-carboxy-7-deazaguanine synthase
MLKGYIDEVFVSVQGEGPLVGTPMLFIRLAGCSQACDHCDTLHARTQVSQFTFYGFATEVIPNPIAAGDLSVRAFPLLKNLPFLAITGGEPLEQPGFLSLLLTRLVESGKRVLLETNGFHLQELSEILPRLSVVAVDIKLPSFSGHAYDAGAVAAFLRKASGITCYAKVVVGPDTPEEEVADAARIVADVKRDLPFIIQPRFDEGLPPPAEAQRLVEIAIRLNTTLSDIRVIPQTHRLLGLR